MLDDTALVSIGLNLNAFTYKPADNALANTCLDLERVPSKVPNWDQF